MACLSGWLTAQLPLQLSVSFALITSSPPDRWAGQAITCFVPTLCICLQVKFRTSTGRGNPCGVTRGLQHLIEVNRCVAAARFPCHRTSSTPHPPTTHTHTHRFTENTHKDTTICRWKFKSCIFRQAIFNTTTVRSFGSQTKTLHPRVTIKMTLNSVYEHTSWLFYYNVIFSSIYTRLR